MTFGGRTATCGNSRKENKTMNIVRAKWFLLGIALTLQCLPVTPTAAKQEAPRPSLVATTSLWDTAMGFIIIITGGRR